MKCSRLLLSLIQVGAAHGWIERSGSCRGLPEAGDFFVVRVRVLLTPAYATTAPDFWRDLSVGLIQNKQMAAMSVEGVPLYDDNGGLYAADVFAKFSISGVRSNSVPVEVVPPEGARVRATFDLSRLR